MHGTSHTGEASVPATAIRAGCHVRPPRSALLIKRSNALSSALSSVIKLAGWPAKAVTGRQHQTRGTGEHEELAALGWRGSGVY